MTGRTSVPMEERARVAEGNKKRARRRLHEQMQDLEWMAYGGETTEGAAQRCGVSRDGLWKRVDKAQRKDLWDRLLANEVARFGATLYEIHQLEHQAKVKGTLRGPRKAA